MPLVSIENGTLTHPATKNILVSEGWGRYRFDDGCPSVPLISLPCAAVAITGVLFNFGPAFLTNEGPSSGVVLHYPVKSRMHYHAGFASFDTGSNRFGHGDQKSVDRVKEGCRLLATVKLHYTGFVRPSHGFFDNLVNV